MEALKRVGYSWQLPQSATGLYLEIIILPYLVQMIDEGLSATGLDPLFETSSVHTWRPCTKCATKYTMRYDAICKSGFCKEQHLSKVVSSCLAMSQFHFSVLTLHYIQLLVKMFVGSCSFTLPSNISLSLNLLNSFRWTWRKLKMD